MLKLGDYNTLRIVKSVDFGLYLDGGEEGEILLPQRYVTKDMHIGDDIEVFIYLDQEERPVATTMTSKCSSIWIRKSALWQPQNIHTPRWVNLRVWRWHG